MPAFKDSVVARLDRATQYSEMFVIGPTGRGVLDAPVKPAHDSEGAGGRPYPFFFTSLTLVNSMPSARSLV